MKRCPECRKDYLDDSLLYCLDDGTALVQGSVNDEPATAILSKTVTPGEGQTLALKVDDTAQPTANITSRLSGLFSGVRLPWIAAIVLTAVIAGIAGWSLRRGPTSDTQRMVLNLVPPMQLTLSQVGSLGSVIEISPDGSALLVRGTDGLYVRNFDSMDFYKVPGTEESRNQPSWKGSSVISFSTDNEELVSVRLPDGPPDVGANFGRRGFSRGRSWSDKETLLLSMYERLETRGQDGKPLVIENSTKREGRFLSPEFIPGHEDFLVYFREKGAATGEVWLGTLSGGTMTNVSVLFKNETAARYTSAGGGRVMFVRNDNLYSQKLDLSTRTVVGEPEMVAKGVASQPAGSVGKADFSVSRNGVIAWRAGRAGSSQTTVFDRSGKPIDIAGPAGDIDTMSVSPKDESRILVIGDSGYTSFIAEVGQDGRVETGGNGFWLDWTADGEKLYGFRGDAIIARPVDGGTESVVGQTPWKEDWGFMDLSPDGRSLLITCGTLGPLCMSTLSDEGVFGEPVPITSSKGAHFDGGFSPDGHFIVYSILDGGIYVQPFPGLGRRVQIAPKGADPVWRRDGKEILFVDGYSSVMSVSVSGPSGGLSFGAPEKLFGGLRRSSSSLTRSRGLGVTGDGSRIYWVQGAEQPDDGVINVMFGFFNDK